ncbi:MAG: hypothetical protein WBG44_11260 [Comamonas sp.]
MRLKGVTRRVAARVGTLACIGTAGAGVWFSNIQATQTPSTGSGLAGAYLPVANPLLAGGILADGSAAAPSLSALNLDFPDLSTPYVTPASNLGNTIRQAETISACWPSRPSPTST